MKRKFSLLIMIALMALMNMYVISTASTRSHVYPFSRILLGDQLTASIGEPIQPEPFGARALMHDEGKREPAIRDTHIQQTLIGNDGKSLGNVYYSGRNTNLIWFYAFLLIVGNVHLVFSIIVFAFRNAGHQSKLFIVLSLLQGIWYFFITEHFFSSWVHVAFPIFSIFLAFAVFLSGFYLSGKRPGIRADIIFAVCTVMFIIIAYTPLFHFSLRIKTVFMFIYISLFSLFSFLNLLITILRTQDSYAIKNMLPSLCGIAISFIVPPFIFALCFLKEVPFYIQYASIFSLALPLFMGQNIFYYNIFSSKFFFLRSSILFIVNILTALIMACLLFFIAQNVHTVPYLIFWLIVCFIVFTALIAASRKFRRRLANTLVTDRANHSRSLQNVEMLAATPEELDFKIERIFTELSLILGVSEMRLLLFGEGTELIKTKESGLLERLSKDCDLAKYFTSEKGALFSYELIRWSPFEERIVRFMQRRQCILAIPIFTENEIIGALLLGAKQNGELYFSHDISYLETIALQIRQMLENDRLLNNYFARRRFEMELDIASFVQSRLFPRNAPSSGKIAISFYNRPYLKVTGDYFDFIEIDKKNTAIIIGDISGHGLAAAMILSMISSTFHTLLKEKIPIEGIIEEINYLLNNRYRGTELITLFAGIYNNATGELRYINAGHCAPILLHQATQSFSTLDGRSKIIGADPSALYLASIHNFESGDELFLFTDGATEIYDEKTGRSFSETNLIETIRKNINMDIEEKIHALIEKINLFGDSIKDDITLIAIKFR